MVHVLIVDDHPMVCFGLGALVRNTVRDVQLHVANTFQEGIDKLSSQSMDMIMLDLALPGGMGMEMIERLRRVQPEVKILICTARDELLNAPLYVQGGANGFLHKHSSDVEAEKAIRAVLENRKYVSDNVKKLIFSNLVNSEPLPVDPIQTLTKREKQVLNLILKGKWLKEIAKELNTQVSTVGTQKANIFRKLGVENTVDLVRKIDLYAESGYDLR